MPPANADLKGKGKARELPERADIGSSSDGTSSISDSDSSFEDSDSESITQEYLDSLIAKAKAAVVNKRQKNTGEHVEEEVIILGGEEEQECVFEVDDLLELDH